MPKAKIGYRRKDESWKDGLSAKSGASDGRSHGAETPEHAGKGKAPRAVRGNPVPGSEGGPCSPDPRRDLSHLSPCGGPLFGRKKDLEGLDAAWEAAKRGDADRPRIVMFTGQGGAGKSALVRRWLETLETGGSTGDARVFGWTFHALGVKDGDAAHSDAFLAEALAFFGDSEPGEGTPWGKGERLARFAGSRPAILILDGLDPLQACGAADPGRLCDPGVNTFLHGCLKEFRGLVLLTSRLPLPGWSGRPGVAHREVGPLDGGEALSLLRAAGIKGADADLEALAERFGLNAFALTLAASYLREKDPDGSPGAGQAWERWPGKDPVERVLTGMEILLSGSPELDVLNMLGLFDGPADEGCLAALCAEPSIPGLTDQAGGMDDSSWAAVLNHLVELRLVSVRRTAAASPSWKTRLLNRIRLARFRREPEGHLILEAHATVRSHFGRQLRERNMAAWREGNRRLCEHLASVIPYWPEGMAGLQPLYGALAYGCRAGFLRETCGDLYRDRIQRGRKAYSAKTLGAIGSDLNAIAFFFDEPWSRPHGALSEQAQAWLLNEAGFSLRVMGRLAEALAPMQGGLEIAIRQENWKVAAVASGNLAELELALGDVAAAQHDAERAVVLSDRHGVVLHRMRKRTVHGEALHALGRRAKAMTRFREAEQLQSRIEPDYPLLYAAHGFRYGDLLLADAERGAWAHVLGLDEGPEITALLASTHSIAQRMSQTLRWAEENGLSMISSALDHLTLGRAALYQAVLGEAALDGAHAELEQAVAALRLAGQPIFIPAGLLTLGWLLFLEGDSAKATDAFEEAREIAEGGSMKLHLADIHLHRGRLWKDAAALSRGRDLVMECGYLRRQEELEDAARAARGWA
jgi:tetratricopeptide (TPR) repeat protein